MGLNNQDFSVCKNREYLRRATLMYGYLRPKASYCFNGNILWISQSLIKTRLLNFPNSNKNGRTASIIHIPHFKLSDEPGYGLVISLAVARSFFGGFIFLRQAP